MKTIRRDVFETNSSSCHALVIFMKDEFEELKKNNSYIYKPYEMKECKVLSNEEVKELSKDLIEKDEYLDEEDKKDFFSKEENLDTLIKDGEFEGENYSIYLYDYEIETYKSAYEDSMFPDEGEDNYIFEKGNVVVLSGQREC